MRSRIQQFMDESGGLQFLRSDGVRMVAQRESGGYSLTAWRGLLLLSSESYESVSQLRSAMRRHAPIRTWRKRRN